MATIITPFTAAEIAEELLAVGEFQTLADAVNAGFSNAGGSSAGAIIHIFPGAAEAVQSTTATAAELAAEANLAANPSVIKSGAVALGKTATGFAPLALLSMEVGTLATALGAAYGVGIGVELWKENPKLWNDISRTLLPYCYPGTNKVKAYLQATYDTITGKMVYNLLVNTGLVDKLKNLFNNPEEVRTREMVEVTDSRGRTIYGTSLPTNFVLDGLAYVYYEGILGPVYGCHTDRPGFYSQHTVKYRSPDDYYPPYGLQFGPGYNASAGSTDLCQVLGIPHGSYTPTEVMDILNDVATESELSPTPGVHPTNMEAPAPAVVPEVIPIIIIPDPLGPDYQPIPDNPEEPDTSPSTDPSKIPLPLLPEPEKVPALPPHEPEPIPDDPETWPIPEPEKWPEEEPWPVIIPFPWVDPRRDPTQPEYDPSYDPEEDPEAWPEVMPWPLPQQPPEEWPETPPETWPEEEPYPPNWPEELPYPVPYPDPVPWTEPDPDPDKQNDPEKIDPYIRPTPNPYEFPDPRADPSPYPYPYPWPDPDPRTQPVPDPRDDPTKEGQPDRPYQPVPYPDPDAPFNPNPNPTSPTPDTPNPRKYPEPPVGESPDPYIIPDTPLAYSGSHGLITVYHPSAAELYAFADWLWVTYQDATIDKIWNNPFDGVIGLMELYCTPTDVGTKSIRSGFLDSGVVSPIISRYTTVDCGTIGIPEYYGNYLDYSPYSRAYIYLPFIGIVELNVDDIVKHCVNVLYHVDEYNGSCIAQITVTKVTEVNGEEITYSNTMYQFSGNCAVELPLSGGSQANIRAGMMQAAAWGLSSVIGGIINGAMSGGIAGAIAGGVSGAAYGAAQALNSVVSAKSSVQHSGSFGASYGAMGIKTPYIIITRPQQIQVPNYEWLYGYPAHAMVTVGACTGYLRVREVHVMSSTASDEEKVKIEELLKTGVYVTE